MYYQCIWACPPGDTFCVGMCARDYDENKAVCPCQPGCPSGCPCPEYLCPFHPPLVQLKSVLILSTYKSNKAVITDGNGKEEYPVNDFMFMFGTNTEAAYSCSVTWRGELFIFGGYAEKRQISKLNGCKLERVGSLTFDHYFGACAVVNNDHTIYLCFDYNNSFGYKKCRKANEPLGVFKEISSSNYEHIFARIAASQGTSF